MTDRFAVCGYVVSRTPRINIYKEKYHNAAGGD